MGLRTRIFPPSAMKGGSSSWLLNTATFFEEKNPTPLNNTNTKAPEARESRGSGEEGNQQRGRGVTENWSQVCLCTASTGWMQENIHQTVPSF